MYEAIVSQVQNDAESLRQSAFSEVESLRKTTLLAESQVPTRFCGRVRSSF